MSQLLLRPLTHPRLGSFTLAGAEPATIGRGPECEVPVIEANVSRKHASFESRNGQWYVTDLNSKLGTELNGAPLKAGIPVALVDGDRIRFGGVAEFCVALAGTTPTTICEMDDGRDRLETLSARSSADLDAPRLLDAAVELPRELHRAECESSLYSTACRFVSSTLGDVLRSTSILIAPIEKDDEVVVLARSAPVRHDGRGAALGEDLPLSRRVVAEVAKHSGSVVCLHRAASPATFAATVPDAVETVASTLIEYTTDGRPIVLYTLGEQQISTGQRWIADFLGLIAELTRHHLLLLRRSRLCKYFSPSVVEMMMGRGALERVEREPQKTEATTLFFDLRGFSLAADGGLDDLLAVHSDLQQVMSIVTEEVFASNGAVLDYHGDGLQAAWGVPIIQDDQADRAVACAKSIIARLATTDLQVFTGARASGQSLCGMGIDRGEVLAGPVGSREQFKYGILGAVVNRAARLESLTKPNALHAPILITRPVRDSLRDPAHRTRRVGRVRAAGMRTVMEVHEVLSDDDSARPWATDAAIARWHDALDGLEATRSPEDLDRVRSIARDLEPDDRRAGWMDAMLASLSDPERLERWDGVIRFDRK